MFLFGNTKSLNAKLEKYEHERDLLTQKIATAANCDANDTIMDIISVNLSQLNEYYTINKAQSKSAYSLSMITIIIGIGLLSFGIALYILYPAKYPEALTSGLFGVISSFIGATSLVLYKESIAQINIFYEKLTHLQYVMLAIHLLNKLPDEKKSEQINFIIDSILNKNK